MATIEEIGKLEEVVFERLVLGEDAEQLRTQLAGRMSDQDADQLLAQARTRIEAGRGSDAFAETVRKIRKRRLVGRRYLWWKVLAGVLIVFGALSGISLMVFRGDSNGSFSGLLIGGIILAIVEWRERRIIQPEDQPEVGD